MCVRVVGWYLPVCLLLIVNPILAKSQITLSEEEVRLRSLKQNVQVQIATLEKEIEHYKLPQAQAIYDPLVKARVVHQQDKSQRTTTIFGTETNTTQYGVNLSQKTPIGTELTLGFGNERQTSDSPFATVNPAHDASVDMSLKQPVAQNSFGYINRKQIEVVKQQLESLELATYRRIEAIVYENLNAFWAHFAAHHIVQYEREALMKAIELYQANQEKLALGIIEDPDLHAFAANRDLHRAQLYEAKDHLVAAAETVRLALRLDPDVTIIPGKRPFKQRPQYSVHEALMIAMENRKDYLALKKVLEAQKIQLATANNQRWPEIDILASLSLNGIDNEYVTAVANVGDGHPQWAVGLEITQSLLNRYDQSAFKQERLRKAKMIMDIKDQELALVKEIKEAYTQYQNAWHRMNAAEEMRHHEHEKMRGEFLRYEQGRSDSDTLIRYQNDYIEAKKFALLSQVNYERSRIRFAFAQGKLLE